MKVMGEIAAIPVGDRGQQPMTVFARFGFNLGDARKIAANLLRVGVFRCAEFVKPHLLIEMEIGFRTFAGPGIARVKNARAVGISSRAAAAGGILDAGNGVRQMAARGGLEEMERAVLAALLGKAEGHQTTVLRRHKPVHDGMSTQTRGAPVVKEPGGRAEADGVFGGR